MLSKLAATESRWPTASGVAINIEVILELRGRHRAKTAEEVSEIVADAWDGVIGGSVYFGAVAG